MILLLSRYSNWWISYQERQRPQSLGRRDGEAQRHHQRVADQIAHHRNQTAKKCHPDRHHQMRQALGCHENSRQRRVYGGDRNLGAHHHVKAAVKSGQPPADPVAAQRIQVRAPAAGGMRPVQPRVQKHSNRHQTAYNQIHKLRRGPAREIGELTQMARLVAHQIENLVLQAWQIREGQRDVVSVAH